MKLLKRLLIVFGILVALLLVGAFALWNTAQKATTTYQNFDFGSLNLSSVEDGTYVGSEDGKLVKASVEVTVKDHTITKVTILSHDCGQGKPAEAIVNDIAANNSLAVDTISGATLSSNVIKKAVYNALNN